MFDSQGRRKYLNEKERRKYFKAAKKDTDKARQAFCLTLFYTGCRISEALNLTVGRIDSSQKAVVFETLKRRRSGVFRSVPVPDRFAVLLGQLTAGKSPDAKIWAFSRPTAYRLVKSLMAVARIKGAMSSPKGLRHSFAVACIGKNIPLPTIQKWMGHAKLETTAIYLGVSGEEERKLARRLWDGQN